MVTSIAGAAEIKLIDDRTTRIFPKWNGAKFHNTRVIDNIFDVEAVKYRLGNRSQTYQEIRITLAGGGGFMTNRVARVYKTGKKKWLTRYYNYVVPLSFDASITETSTLHGSPKLRLTTFAPKNSVAEQNVWEGAEWSVGSEFGWKSVTPNGSYTKSKKYSYRQKGVTTRAKSHHMIDSNGNWKNRRNSTSWFFNTQFFRPNAGGKVKRHLWKGQWHSACDWQSHFYHPDSINATHSSGFTPKVSAVYQRTGNRKYEDFILNTGMTIQYYVFGKAGCNMADKGSNDWRRRVNQQLKISLDWDDLWTWKTSG